MIFFPYHYTDTFLGRDVNAPFLAVCAERSHAANNESPSAVSSSRICLKQEGTLLKSLDLEIWNLYVKLCRKRKYDIDKEDMRRFHRTMNSQNI